MSLIKALQNPALYDHSIDKFEVIETHISWVLLTGEYVYKIKKPVNYGFLDFSTLEKRHFFCEEELRLNRRLAPQLYLDVVSIHGSEAHPQLNGQGAVIEYAVKMRQFPQSVQLDRLLAKDGLDNSVMDNLARKVAQFHLSITSVDKESSYGDVEHIQQPMLENFTHIRASIDDQTITPLLDKLEQWTQQQLQKLSPIIQLRKAQGYVRECHGDMHLRNIALWQDDIVIFDCIEFNENFYWIDVMSEIAFLVMDLEDRQQDSLAQRFLNTYLEITGDYEGLPLFLCYKVYRAMVRVKVDALRIIQEQTGTKEYEQTFREFQQYLKLAERYIKPTTPTLLITFGLSGSGKSFGARLLAEKFPAIQVRSDVERKRLYRVAANGKVSQATQQKLYTPEATQKTYHRLVAIAQCLLNAGYSVIIDAANLKLQQRQQFIELARSMRIRYFILAFQAEEAILKQRVEQRAQQGDDISDATVEILQHQLESYELLSEEEQSFTIEIDSSNDIDIDAIIKQIHS